ncbi:hypothetical protein PF010_g19428 [Phytophthora fragariae]|uniref:Uncharacterized protein n=1 Tax=Phytophthora fragariae TaxID=53985 RepID=A0A6A4CKK6_9STRA|nr:hypothetical protein PF003_g18417 [Phytophthora fragariae]KAE8988533.1 hypothetical protein PF011_g19131 [Phytophthora fragariae]KAE9088292.1 hypothetical protein PF010_g19428 [Phytophthora fragariae]KAE9242088.1 hypothetical protein PF002_g8932 [Phytophthora fragariae]KAE9289958.1 hypothetical protein PF001_g19801 [Phytophthora fragariae]
MKIFKELIKDSPEPLSDYAESITGQGCTPMWNDSSKNVWMA